MPSQFPNTALVRQFGPFTQDPGNVLQRSLNLPADSDAKPAGQLSPNSANYCFVKHSFLGYVIPAQAANQCHDLDSRLRGNDGEPQFQVGEPQFQALTKH
jgi:hypothetical protein